MNISGTQSTARGFEGCIFRMEIDNVYPLKRAFQDPKPSFVQLYPEGRVELIGRKLIILLLCIMFSQFLNISIQ